MRLGFDVSPLHRPHPPGVVRATRGLVLALERRRVLEVERLAPRAGANLRRWRHAEVAEELARRGLAAFHSPVSAFPVLAARRAFRRVHTVHELPWRHGAEENAGVLHRAWSGLAGRRADATVVPSAFVERDLRAEPFAGARRVAVVPWGVDACFTVDADARSSRGEAAEPDRASAEPARTSRARAERVRAWSDFALVVGGARPKKNADALLRALRVLPATRRPNVVITGAATDEDVARLRAAAGDDSARVRFEPELADEDLAVAYRAARAVVVLSRSEGFAFPVVEGFACGAPAIVARGTAQAELAGDAGLAVDAESAEEVARALERAADERARLSALGRARAAMFTWDAAAERVERLWKELAP